ncbi:inositol 1,3,4-trisphosphate 5/6-kinase 4 isoform X1 [Beta vulgaris subsp. vulgaris]|uniref:inositol 1,3,4-trisphosphate 5/6-kinase 4 isoform X1 n=1 Tax=Beta vulgaris subsp. vulgaris TaxID=3555 RepID=UPI002036C177|nr:inositol 1,3,4-trisphosphate 5/6-kinase 4 isoform X1 [Beta vulgaris subsp. vulgaris]
MGGVVGGVILDGSVLLADDSDVNGAPTFRAGADFLFRALQFSQLHKGILLGEDLSADKVNILKKISEVYSFTCFRFSFSTVEVVMDEIAVAWEDVGKKTLFVLPSHKMDCCHKLCDHGCLLSILDLDNGGDTIKHPSVHHIKKLEQLPLSLCLLNKKVASSEVVTVGYSMKPSRQADFAKRGAFPLYSVQHELMFLPLSYELPLPLQLQEIDLILHKATDDIVSIELDSSVIPKIIYTNGMEELRRTLVDHPRCCVIDPFNNIYPVLDRLKIQYLLLGLEGLNKQGYSKIRGAHFLKVDCYNDPKLMERLMEAKVSLPSIVKPQVACGVSSAHSMAIVFTLEDYKDLQVPLPAIIQEYVDHSSTLFKFYVLGEKVFYAVKKSTPNGDVLIKMSQMNQLKPLVFDSLKSLPTAEKNQFGDEALDLELVKNAATWLRSKLDLTIFGFDVVIQEGTRDHVIVDVNYLPSFKEVPNDVAIPAFWEAIKNKFRESKR